MPTASSARSKRRSPSRAKSSPSRWEGKHFLGMRELTKEQILRVLDLAARLKITAPQKIGTPLKGKRLFNFFVEASTRTKTSFGIAARSLGCEVIDFSPSSSSLSKGESLIDTARTIESMGIDYAVIRHSASGAPWFLADRIRAHVINAGDGAHEHPTQAALDLLTMREALGRVTGLNVVLVGDITYSRVARSNIWAHKALGNRMTVVAPPTLMPTQLESLGVRVSYNLDEVLPKADVLMMLRLQKERQASHMFPSAGDYVRRFGLDRERFSRLKARAIVMHPGPLNRGLEICSEAADSGRSVILHQVRNGVFVRMAVLLLLSGVKI